MAPSSVRPLFADRLGRWSVRAAQIVVILLLVGIAVFLLLQVKLVAIAVIVAAILASAAAPLIAWLRRVGAPRTLAAAAVLGAATLVLLGVVALIGFAVQRQWDTLTQSASDGLDQLLQWLRTLPLPVDQLQWADVGDEAKKLLSDVPLGAGAIAGASVIADIATGTVLAIVVFFFLIKDGDRIWAFLLHRLSASGRERGERLGPLAVTVMGGYARGTAIIAAVDAVLIGAALFILQVPLALPITVLIFLGAFIPIVGATATGVLAALIALVTNGLPAAIIVGVVIIVVNQLEGNLLQPVVMSQSVRLHPLVVLLALSAGALLGGIAGAVLAVPVVAVAWAMISHWDGHPQPDPADG